MIRSYTELLGYHTFEDRFRYLKLSGSVGASTFGFDRYLNQIFYTNRTWKLVRQEVIARDMGCDLGVEGREIFDKILIHHMNPMTKEELLSGSSDVLNPEFLITTTPRTHNAIHYGDERLLPKAYIPRRPGDTTLW